MICPHCDEFFDEYNDTQPVCECGHPYFCSCFNETIEKTDENYLKEYEDYLQLSYEEYEKYQEDEWKAKIAANSSNLISLIGNDIFYLKDNKIHKSKIIKVITSSNGCSIVNESNEEIIMFGFSVDELLLNIKNEFINENMFENLDLPSLEDL